VVEQQYLVKGAVERHESNGTYQKRVVEELIFQAATGR